MDVGNLVFGAQGLRKELRIHEKGDSQALTCEVPPYPLVQLRDSQQLKQGQRKTFRVCP